MRVVVERSLAAIAGISIAIGKAVVALADLAALITAIALGVRDRAGLVASAAVAGGVERALAAISSDAIAVSEPGLALDLVARVLGAFCRDGVGQLAAIVAAASAAAGSIQLRLAAVAVVVVAVAAAILALHNAARRFTRRAGHVGQRLAALAAAPAVVRQEQVGLAAIGVIDVAIRVARVAIRALALAFDAARAAVRERTDLAAAAAIGQPVGVDLATVSRILIAVFEARVAAFDRAAARVAAHHCVGRIGTTLIAAAAMSVAGQELLAAVAAVAVAVRMLRVAAAARAHTAGATRLVSAAGLAAFAAVLRVVQERLAAARAGALRVARIAFRPDAAAVLAGSLGVLFDAGALAAAAARQAREIRLAAVRRILVAVRVPAHTARAQTTCAFVVADITAAACVVVDLALRLGLDHAAQRSFRVRQVTSAAATTAAASLIQVCLAAVGGGAVAVREPGRTRLHDAVRALTSGLGAVRQVTVLSASAAVCGVVELLLAAIGSIVVAITVASVTRADATSPLETSCRGVRGLIAALAAVATIVQRIDLLLATVVRVVVAIFVAVVALAQAAAPGLAATFSVAETTSAVAQATMFS